MFTGIVTDLGQVVEALDAGPSLRRFRIASRYAADSIDIGASIACAGVCLTVTACAPRGDGVDGALFTVETAAETLARTRARHWQVGTVLNLERSLKVGDELGGHLVTGHVDGLATVQRIEAIAPDPSEPWGATARYHLDIPPDLARFVAPKGSVCLDGTSLTVNEVEGCRFTVLLIPHTLQVTTWGAVRTGDALHIEVDLMARYAARLAEHAPALAPASRGSY